MALCSSRVPMLPWPSLLLAPSLQSVPGSVFITHPGGAEGGSGAGAQSESGSREPIRIALGIPGAQLKIPPEKNFLKGPFGHKCCDCISWFGSLGPVFVCLKPFLSALPFLTPYPFWDWERNLQKEPV